MFRAFHPPRRRHLRLLATLLVTLSLLGNALGFAYAAAPMAMKDCCAQMGAHAGGHCGHCGHPGSPDPGQRTSCDEQCLMRCASSTVLPTLAWMPLPGAHQTPSAPPLAADFRPLADSGPGLRPPISA